MEFPKSFNRLLNYAFAASVIASSIITGVSARADATQDLATTLRISGTVTGGLMPTTAPEFATMKAQVAAGDYYGAALTAARSTYFANYLARRLARQMQNSALDAGIVPDNDATTFLVAHFAGPNPNISGIWSENATYLVRVTRNGTPTNVRARDLTAAELRAVNWRDDLVRVDGQTVKDQNDAAIPLPAQHVGGYVTLSDRTDASLADYGATAGTNLRYIESIYQTAFGLSLTETSSTDARIQDVPKFIPSYDSNFTKGTGQPACMSCHAGGMASLNHGYCTVADTFDFDNGLVYIANPTNGTMKSLGSDQGKRNATQTCNLNATPKPVCNPDSQGCDATKAWDVQTTWKDSGLLARMGWKGAVTGSGLNSFGVAIGQATGVYTWLTKRVIQEVCPVGSVRDAEIAAIAANGQSADDVKVIVAGVASHPSCR